MVTARSESQILLAQHRNWHWQFLFSVHLHDILLCSGSWRRDVPPRDERDERFRGMPRDIRLDEKEAERWKRGPDRGSDRPSDRDRDRDGPSRGPPPPRSGGGTADGPWRRGGGMCNW